jgi:hypothetical protein
MIKELDRPSTLKTVPNSQYFDTRFSSEARAPFPALAPQINIRRFGKLQWQALLDNEALSIGIKSGE